MALRPPTTSQPFDRPDESQPFVNRAPSQGQSVPPAILRPKFHVVITGATADDGVYDCDVFILNAGRVPDGTALTLAGLKGDAAYPGALFVDTGESSNELASGTVVFSDVSFVNFHDGKPVFAGLGLRLTACVTP